MSLGLEASLIDSLRAGRIDSRKGGRERERGTKFPPSDAWTTTQEVEKGFSLSLLGGAGSIDSSQRRKDKGRENAHPDLGLDDDDFYASSL